MSPNPQHATTTTQPAAPALACARAQVSATAPPTGQHTVEDDLRDEALACFFRPEQQASTAPTTGGVNNIVQYVNTADGHKYVLRIYNNGNKTEKVRACWGLSLDLHRETCNVHECGGTAAAAQQQRHKTENVCVGQPWFAQGVCKLQGM